jgi:ribbon-helix-helix CopG family protein
MRTTLTLDDDVAARLQAEARRTGRPFKSVVNESLRIALAQSAAVRKQKPFKIMPRSMGGPIAGVSYDNIGVLIEELEGDRHG